MVKQSELSGVRRIKPVLIGVAAGLVIAAVLLFLFAILIVLRDVPQALIDPMAIFSLVIGSLVSGIVCTRITRSGGLFYGTFCGGLLSVLVLLIGFFIGSAGIGLPGVFRVLFVMISAMIGGVIGANMRKKPGYR